MMDGGKVKANPSREALTLLRKGDCDIMGKTTTNGFKLLRR